MAKSCFDELKVDVPEITPGPRTGGRATGPAYFWRRRRFAERRRAEPLYHSGDGARAALFEEVRVSPPKRVAAIYAVRVFLFFSV